MPRYFAKPKAWVEDDLYEDDYVPSESVQVCDHEATFTGLLDASGDEIWRAPNPIGFGRDEDW